MTTNQFPYLADKIKRATIDLRPFKHVYIENFFEPEHFKLLTNDPQIKQPVAESTRQLVEQAIADGWIVHSDFPGCIDNIDEYITKLESNNWAVDTQRLDRQGIALKLKQIRNPLINELLEYLNTDEFKQVMLDKFDIVRPTKITTSIHKYLDGYEISPHPDIRSKTLTYLVNINTDPRADDLDIHTQLMKLVPKKHFIYDYWEHNTEYDRDWLPWEWCTTEKIINKNNSIVLFSPGNDTLHAVKLKYDHLEFQRTQI